MDFAMREVLTVIIGLAILAVVLDGVRRMRQSRRESIKMSKMAEASDRLEPAGYGSELPSGGARVVGQRDEATAEQLNRSVKQAYSASRTTSGYKIPEQVALNLDESVPMLMDSVAEPKNPRRTKPPEEPSLGDLEELDLDTETPEPAYQAETGSADDLDELPEPDQADLEQPEPEQAEFERPEFESEPVAREPESHGDDDEGNFVEPDEVLVINVMAPSGYYFAGNDLLDVAVEAGLRFGEMDIFHRHLELDGRGPILFSMANIVTPGTYDLKAMDEFKTPGVSLFLALPCAVKSMAAFDMMLEVAHYLADNLGGELKDEQRSVMTSQTSEHYRQRVREYERKRLMQPH